MRPRGVVIRFPAPEAFRCGPFLFSLLAITLIAAVPVAQTSASGRLTVYVVDVEGGNATLLVSPSRQSLLIDTGNPGARDADRILAAAKDAGLTQIDDADHNPLSRRPRRRGRRSCLPDPDSTVRRPRPQRGIGPRYQQDPRAVRRALRQGGAYGGEGWRHHPDRGPGRARRRLGGTNDQEGAARRRRIESATARHLLRRRPTRARTPNRSAASSRSGNSGWSISAI